MLNISKFWELTKGLPQDTHIFIKNEDGSEIPLDSIMEFSKQKGALIIHSSRIVKKEKRGGWYGS